MTALVLVLMALATQTWAASLDREAEKLVQSVLKDAPIRGRRLAVGDFPDSRGRVSDLSTAISEALEGALVRQAKAHGFKLLDRRKIHELKQEWALGYTGMVDERTASKAGRLWGVEGFLLGGYFVDGKQVTVRVKLIESQTGQILAGGSFAFKDRRLAESVIPEQQTAQGWYQRRPETNETISRQTRGSGTQPERHTLGIGVNYLGGQVRYHFAPAWAGEVRYVTGRENSEDGAINSQVVGLRLYRFYGGKDLHLFVGVEGDYVTSSQNSTSFKVSGLAAGAFGGLAYPISSRLSIGADIGPYVFSLKESSTRVSNSSLEFVANSFFNFYVF